MTTFFVPGIPVPKGSARAFVNRYTGKAAVLQTNREKQKPWASLISYKAEEAGLKPTEGGCTLELTFWMPRPKAHYTKKGLRPSMENASHLKKPDLDKLIRLVLDALTGIAYPDDSHVVAVDAMKRFVTLQGQNPGCAIVVTQI